MLSLKVCRESCLWFLLAAAIAGCGQGGTIERSAVVQERYVLCRGELGRGSGGTRGALNGCCSEITSRDGCAAVAHWIASNRGVLEAPDVLRQIQIVTQKRLVYIGNDGACRLWDVWLHIPDGTHVRALSKAEIVGRPWRENVPYKEYQRLKEVFKSYGKTLPQHYCLPGQSPSGEPIRQPQLVPDWGAFALRLRDENSAGGASGWKFCVIDGDPGRELVRQWVLGNYESLKCAKAASAHMAVLRTRGLYWFDGKQRACVELLTEIPVGGGYSGEAPQWVGNLPVCEVERLLGLFREYGKARDFGPHQFEVLTAPESQLFQPD